MDLSKSMWCRKREGIVYKPEFLLLVKDLMNLMKMSEGKVQWWNFYLENYAKININHEAIIHSMSTFYW